MEDLKNLQAVKQINDPVQYLFNIVAACLLKEIRYYDNEDQRRTLIMQSLVKVATIDPEFVLQLAVYLRNELYIRTTTNFIVAFAVVHPKTKDFVSKYFNYCILLPTDLIEVCQYAQIQIFYKKNKYNDFNLQQLEQKQYDIRKNLKIPKVLQKCAAKKFIEFSEYQLGKYCSDSKRKKQLLKLMAVKNPEKWKAKREARQILLQKKLDKSNQGKMDIETTGTGKGSAKEYSYSTRGRVAKVGQKGRGKAHQMKKKHQIKPQTPKTQLDSPFISMKDIIFLSHISQPRQHVLQILGKRYPKDEQEFNKVFQIQQAENDMQHQQQQQIQFNQVLAGKRMKLPIPITWETELSEKGNKKEVWEQLIRTNKLPYMAMMRNLRNILKAQVADEVHQIVVNKIKDTNAVFNSKMFPLQFLSALQEIDKALTVGIPINKSNVDNEENKQSEEIDEEQEMIQLDNQIGQSYKEAIQKAIEISVEKNLEQITGVTAIFADVSGSMSSPISGGKNYGSIHSCLDICILLGLMIKQKCQKSSFFIFSSPGKNQKCYIEVHLPSNDILACMNIIKLETSKLGGGTDFPYECIQNWHKNNQKVDNIIILSDMMISDGYQDIQQKKNSTVQVIRDYQQQINPTMKIFSIDLRGQGKALNLGDEFNEQNYIRIFGMSDSILKFITTKEGISQVEQVKKYAQEVLDKKSLKK